MDEAAVGPSIALENGLDLRELLTTGSVVHINDNYDQVEDEVLGNKETMRSDYIGQPVPSIAELEKQLTQIDQLGFVKKKILEAGGGLPLDKKFTISFAFSGFWENSEEPFDYATISKPLIVNLKDNGLLPGIQMAVESMLVGEISVFLLSYKVMYGKFGVPPRIKPKSDCVFYIKLVKAVITPSDGPINYEEPNIFKRVKHEVKLLYSHGTMLYKTNNYYAAIHKFTKAVNMLHKCRLANEDEEKLQEMFLKKLYLNLAICYNEAKQPFKACIACNELNRLDSLWNNGKALFQNAKALRMIGDYDGAEKRLKMAMELCSTDSIIAESELLNKVKESCNQKKIMSNRILNSKSNIVSDHFKADVDDLIQKFKENMDLCKFTLPGDLNDVEKEYIKEACAKQNLHFTEYNNNWLLDKSTENVSKDELEKLNI